MDRIEQTIRLRDEDKQKKAKLKYNLLMALAAAFSLISIYNLVTLFMIISTMQVQIFNIIPLVISAVLAFICFSKKDDMLIEYDYIVEDDTFVIAKIKNLKARKEVVNVPVSSFKRIDKYNHDNFKELDAKKLNCALNNDSEKYVLTYERGERCAVVFEPNEELLNMIKKELNK